jgi:iron complex outermembrane receptor protein
MLDPFITYNGKNGHRHKLQMRRYYINNKNEFNRANSSANTFGEYQYQRELEAIDLVLTTGIAASTTSTNAALFGDTSFTYNNLGIYIQGEKKINNLSLSAGSRFEHNLQKSPTIFEGVVIPNGESKDQAIVSRLGMSYKVADYTNLRMSWGQGYRFPTISERFIRTSFGGIEVFPNPLLTSEHGYTAEVGIKQGIKVGSINAYADFSIFTSTYYDMIEFAFLADPLGFKPINVGDTRIYGSEISFIGNAKIDKVDLTFLTGYTYIDSKYLNFDEREEIRDNLSTDQNVLKYRSKHAAKFDIEVKWKWLSAGVSLQHYSHHINIDKRLETPFDGVDLFKIKAFRDRNNNGYQILNLRIAAKYKRYKCSILMGNTLNTNYTVRPGLIEAPRNLTVRFDMEI